MKVRLSLALAGALSAVAAGIAFADDDARTAPAVKLLTIIPVPGVGMKTFDISWVDAATQLYYLADRSNKAVDVVNAKTNRFVRQIHAGFTGVASGGNDFSGPNGVVVIGRPGRQFLIVTDAPSRIVSIDLNNDVVVSDVHTAPRASAKRTDELAYDPEHSLILAVNNADEPPFATFIHVDRDTGTLKVVNQVEFPDATNGAEQPVWNPGTGRFYISIPQIGPNPQDGAVKKINPTSGAVEATFPVDRCQPAGLTLGPNNDLLLGCSVIFDVAGNAWTRDPNGAAPAAKPDVVIMDARNGSIDRRVQGVGGNDEVWYNPGDNRYYLAARNQPGGSSGPTVPAPKGSVQSIDNFSPVLGIIDARKMTLDQVVPTVNQAPGSAHSVAVNPHNNHALVPFPVNNVVVDPNDDSVNCHTGCIAVFGTPRRDRDDD